MNKDNLRYSIASLERHPPSSNSRSGLGRCIRDGLLDHTHLIQSGGPWLVVADNQVVFDGINAGEGLGYNSGPLFGTAQFSGAWSNDWQDLDVKAVKTAFESFVERKPKWKCRLLDPSTPVQLIRSYISTNVLEQFESTVLELNSRVNSALASAASSKLGNAASEFLSKTTCLDRNLVCEFKTATEHPLVRLLRHGVLAEYLDGKSVTINLPMATAQFDLELLAERLLSAWLNEAPSIRQVTLRDFRHYYQFHATLISCKRRVARGELPAIGQVLDYLKSILPPEIRDRAELHFVTRKNWPIFRESVGHLQKSVYEPVRQTALATFDSLFQDDFGYGLVVLVDGKIAGMASAGPLHLFPSERGTLSDESREDRRVLYPLDLTVTEEFRGSLGTYLKRGMALIGLSVGHRAFHGRNRDRLAAAMWAINLSLGSYQIRHLPNDYPDDNQYRDCIYYRCPLNWPNTCPMNDSSENTDLAPSIAELLYF